MRSIIIVSSHTDINSIFHLDESFSLLERMNGLMVVWTNYVIGGKVVR